MAATFKQALLMRLTEECGETIKEASKAFLYGGDNIGPDDTQENATKISQEVTDIIAVAEMLVEHGIIPKFGSEDAKAAKKFKVMKYMQMSREAGFVE